MSELITSANIDLVIKKNNEIRDEVLEQTMKLQMNPAIMKVASRSQLALLILQGFGLIQMPIEDVYCKMKLVKVAESKWVFRIY